MKFCLQQNTKENRKINRCFTDKCLSLSNYAYNLACSNDTSAKIETENELEEFEIITTK